MARDLFKEKWEFYKTSLNTKMGWFDLLIANFFWGFIIIKYSNPIYEYILTFLRFSPWINHYLAYLIFGLIFIPVGLTLTFLTTKLYKLFFNNGKIL